MTKPIYLKWKLAGGNAKTDIFLQHTKSNNYERFEIHFIKDN